MCRPPPLPDEQLRDVLLRSANYRCVCTLADALRGEQVRSFAFPVEPSRPGSAGKSSSPDPPSRLAQQARRAWPGPPDRSRVDNHSHNSVVGDGRDDGCHPPVAGGNRLTGLTGERHALPAPIRQRLGTDLPEEQDIAAVTLASILPGGSRPAEPGLLFELPLRAPARPARPAFAKRDVHGVLDALHSATHATHTATIVLSHFAANHRWVGGPRMHGRASAANAG